jgi:hypothetical protein
MATSLKESLGMTNGMGKFVHQDGSSYNGEWAFDEQNG